MFSREEKTEEGKLKVVHEGGEFKGKGGLKLYYQSWKPERVRAVMVAAHGLAKYSGRYKHVAEHFASEGIAFYALDHRSHGLSEGDRGHVDRFDDYVEDLDTFIINRDGKEIRSSRPQHGRNNSSNVRHLRTRTKLIF